MKIFVYTGKMESNTILSNVRHTEQINDCLLQRSPEKYFNSGSGSSKDLFKLGLVQIGTS